MPEILPKERERILAIAREVRQGIDKEFNFCRPRGGCFDAAIELSDRLVQANIEHEVIGGHFLSPNGQPLGPGDIIDPEETLEPTGGHIWVRFPQYDNTILDVTADQFGDFPPIWFGADTHLYEARQILEVKRLGPKHFRVAPVKRLGFRHPRPLRQAKVAVRRHLRHPPVICLCHRSKTVNRVRRKIVRRLR